MKLQYVWLFFFGGGRCVFRKGVLPEGLAKEPPQKMKILNYSNNIGYTIISTNSTWNFDTKNTSDAFKHVPTNFEGTRGRKSGSGTRRWKTLPWTPPNGFWISSHTIHQNGFPNHGRAAEACLHYGVRCGWKYSKHIWTPVGWLQ